MSDPDLDTVVALEQRLLEPAVRRDRAALEALLHEDFTEFGASGGVYDRTAIIATLLAQPDVTATASDFQATRLGPDAILLTYRTEPPSLRSSVWCRDPTGAWRVRFHQGTS